MHSIDVIRFDKFENLMQNRKYSFIFIFALITSLLIKLINLRKSMKKMNK
jgi:hypothetical protein